MRLKNCKRLIFSSNPARFKGFYQDDYREFNDVEVYKAYLGIEGRLNSEAFDTAFAVRNVNTKPFKLIPGKELQKTVDVVRVVFEKNATRFIGYNPNTGSMFGEAASDPKKYNAALFEVDPVSSYDSFVHCFKQAFEHELKIPFDIKYNKDNVSIHKDFDPLSFTIEEYLESSMLSARGNDTRGLSYALAEFHSKVIPFIVTKLKEYKGAAVTC